MASTWLSRALLAALSVVVLRKAQASPGSPQRDDGSEDMAQAPTEAPVRYGSLAVVVLVAVLFVVASGLTIFLAPFGFVRDLDDRLPEAAAVSADAGDAARGRALVVSYGCRACHEVPGLLPLAQHGVGPPLTGFAQRQYIAGVLPNRPANLVDWLQDPPAIAPDTAMPDMGLSREEALDVARYLYATDR